MSSRFSAAAAAAKAGTPGVTVVGTPAWSSRRNCSPIALQIDRSPEWSRATSLPAAVASTHKRHDPVEIERRGVDDGRARRAMIEQRLRHERAGVEADGAAGDEVAPAQSDQVGRARSRADEMHGHENSAESATAQVAPSAASRGPSSLPPAPAPASAAASAMAGAPKRA